MTISILRAKTMNEAKEKGQELSEPEATARACSQVDWNIEDL